MKDYLIGLHFLSCYISTIIDFTSLFKLLQRLATASVETDETGVI